MNSSSDLVPKVGPLPLTTHLRTTQLEGEVGAAVWRPGSQNPKEASAFYPEEPVRAPGTSEGRFTPGQAVLRGRRGANPQYCSLNLGRPADVTRFSGVRSPPLYLGDHREKVAPMTTNSR